MTTKYFSTVLNVAAILAGELSKRIISLNPTIAIRENKSVLGKEICALFESAATLLIRLST